MEWIAAVATAIFAVLTIGILMAMRALVIRLQALQQSALEAKAEITRLSEETRAVLIPAEEAMRNLQEGLEAAKGWFRAIEDAGSMVAKTTSAAEKAANVLSQSAIRHAERLSQSREAEQAVQWAELGLTAWQLWRSGRNPSGSAESDHSSRTSHASTMQAKGNAKNERRQ
ncbi:hypothetical protein ACX93W_00620 [Paenibacillus sp. CAU 1782]